jgi:hypothetical protein
MPGKLVNPAEEFYTILDRRLCRSHIVDEIANANPERTCNPHEHVDRCGIFAPLYLADVIGVEICKFGELFLCQPG